MTVTLGHYRAVVTIELQRGSLDDVGVLPNAGVSGIGGNSSSAMHNHGARGNVNRGGRCQERSIRLFAKVAVRALDFAFSGGIAGGAVHPHGACRGGEPLVDEPW